MRGRHGAAACPRTPRCRSRRSTRPSRRSSLPFGWETSLGRTSHGSPRPPRATRSSSSSSPRRWPRPRATRRERHARVAEFFEESTAELGEAAAALARHWRDAGEPERALGYFIRAAEQADQGWAKDQAAILYREALDLEPEDDETLALLRRRLGVARAAALHIPDARQLMR